LRASGGIGSDDSGMQDRAVLALIGNPYTMVMPQPMESRMGGGG